MNKTTASVRTRKMVTIAFLGAIAAVLTFLSFPLPFLPPFLKLDFSSVPVMIGSFMLGPVSGLAITLIKCLVDLLFGSNSAGVGQLADFLMTGTLALTAGIIYRFNRNRKGATIAAAASVISLTIVGALANYYILLPFYAKAYMPMEAILKACQAINPNITSINGYIWFGVVPFNLLKGIVVAMLTFLLYKRLSIVMHQFTSSEAKPSKKNK